MGFGERGVGRRGLDQWARRVRFAFFIAGFFFGFWGDFSAALSLSLSASLSSSRSLRRLSSLCFLAMRLLCSF